MPAGWSAKARSYRHKAVAECSGHFRTCRQDTCDLHQCRQGLSYRPQNTCGAEKPNSMDFCGGDVAPKAKQRASTLNSTATKSAIMSRRRVLYSATVYAKHTSHSPQSTWRRVVTNPPAPPPPSLVKSREEENYQTITRLTHGFLLLVSLAWTGQRWCYGGKPHQHQIAEHPPGWRRPWVRGRRAEIPLKQKRTK